MKKTKKVKAKKPITKSPPPQKRQQGVMAIIPYSEIAKPEMHKGKFSLVPTRLNEIQIKSIIASTPKNIIKKRPGKGGGNWDYIPGWWFKKKLNFVFGFDGWSTEIEGERVDGDFITVKGRLIIHNTKDGKPMISKSDYGGAEIKYRKNTAHTPASYLDIGNDFKAAQTDLIKRCCVQLGFAMDVYGQNESTDMGQVIEPPSPSPSQPPPGIDNSTDRTVEVQFECSECANPITQSESEFSKKMFGRALCRSCQQLAKQGKIRTGKK